MAGQVVEDLTASYECVEDWGDLSRTGEPPGVVLLGLLSERITLVVIGLWLLIIG